MTPVLYILMRTDLDSMNRGKAMAQASHASNAFVNHEILDGTFGIASNMREDWKHQTEQGFGTVLVLGVTESQMRTAVTVATVSNFVDVTKRKHGSNLSIEAGWNACQQS